MDLLFTQRNAGSLIFQITFSNPTFLGKLLNLLKKDSKIEFVIAFAPIVTLVNVVQFSILLLFQLLVKYPV
jgi:hypothetical protein